MTCIQYVILLMGCRDSVNCTATRYVLNSSGFETWWESNISDPFRPAPRPIQPPVQWIKRQGRGTVHPLLSGARSSSMGRPIFLHFIVEPCIDTISINSNQLMHISVFIKNTLKVYLKFLLTRRVSDHIGIHPQGGHH